MKNSPLPSPPAEPGGHLDLNQAAAEHALTLDYPAHLRQRALLTWHGRMLNEYQSHHVFQELAQRLAKARYGADQVQAASEFAREEQQHGVLCGAVVRALGGSAEAAIERPHVLPLYDDVSPQEGVARHILSICCLSETVAVALIGAERLEMSEGPLRRLLTRIYADEVGHARFGWCFLEDHVLGWPSAAKHRLSAYLRVAFAHLEAHELGHISADTTDPRQCGRELGLCNGADSRALFYDTVTEVIVPELERAGLAARAAWQTRQRASTPSVSCVGTA